MSSETLRARSWEGRPVEEWRERWRIPMLRIYERVTSTNDIARRLAEAGAPPGSVVLADEQTAGRGRAGRPWHAPARAGLLLSIVLRPDFADVSEAAPGTIPLRIGLAVAHAVERVTGLRLRVKWPNDILTDDGRKVAGILCEGTVGMVGNGVVVAGIGVNVGQRAEEFPPDLAASATSLNVAAGRRFRRPDLAAPIISGVTALGADIGAPFGPDALRELAERDALRGRLITVDGVPRGVAWDIGADGALLVRAADGCVVALYNGTIRALQNETLASRLIDP